MVGSRMSLYTEDFFLLFACGALKRVSLFYYYLSNAAQKEEEIWKFRNTSCVEAVESAIFLDNNLLKRLVCVWDHTKITFIGNSHDDCLRYLFFFFGWKRSVSFFKMRIKLEIYVKIPIVRFYERAWKVTQCDIREIILQHLK